MAVLLTYPLTVYYVITHLVPQSCKERRQDGRLGVGLAAARVSPPPQGVPPPRIFNKWTSHQFLSSTFRTSSR